MGRSHISDKALKQAILFFGAVSFFLGKKALEGAPAPVQRAPDPHDDPVIRALRAATRPGA
jgi:hypothetical protein